MTTLREMTAATPGRLTRGEMVIVMNEPARVVSTRYGNQVTVISQRGEFEKKRKGSVVTISYGTRIRQAILVRWRPTMLTIRVWYPS